MVRRRPEGVLPGIPLRLGQRLVPGSPGIQEGQAGGGFPACGLPGHSGNHRGEKDPVRLAPLRPVQVHQAVEAVAAGAAAPPAQVFPLHPTGTQRRQADQEPPLLLRQGGHMQHRAQQAEGGALPEHAVLQPVHLGLARLLQPPAQPVLQRSRGEAVGLLLGRQEEDCRGMTAHQPEDFPRFFLPVSPPQGGVAAKQPVRVVLLQARQLFYRIGPGKSLPGGEQNLCAQALQILHAHIPVHVKIVYHKQGIPIANPAEAEKLCLVIPQPFLPARRRRAGAGRRGLQHRQFQQQTPQARGLDGILCSRLSGGVG